MPFKVTRKSNGLIGWLNAFFAEIQRVNEDSVKKMEGNRTTRRLKKRGKSTVSF